jgi:hypothetical protein
LKEIRFNGLPSGTNKNLLEYKLNVMKTKTMSDSQILDSSTSARIRRKVKNFMDSCFIQTFMTIVTFYALIGDDLKLIYAPKSADELFTNLSIVALILFSLEIILQCIGFDEYYLSFFFWLDILSTASLIADIPPLLDMLTGTESSADQDPLNFDDGEGGFAAGDASIARASRGAKLGSKAGRITRVIRIIRLVRIVKLYKSANYAMAKKDQ